MASESNPKHPPFATFMQRFYAFMIDCLVFFPIIALKTYSLILLKSFSLLILCSLLWMAYKVLMEYKLGATIGKRYVGLRVVNERFESITLGQSVGRFIFYFAIELGSLLALLNLFNNPQFLASTDPFIINQLQIENNTTALAIGQLLYVFSVFGILANPKKQTTHDKISNTYCISIK
jgi:uncharacterized RDD family membrane protein YckC